MAKQQAYFSGSRGFGGDVMNYLRTPGVIALKVLFARPSGSFAPLLRSSAQPRALPAELPGSDQSRIIYFDRTTCASTCSHPPVQINAPIIVLSCIASQKIKTPTYLWLFLPTFGSSTILR
jgi:hypothetical protein